MILSLHSIEPSRPGREASQHCATRRVRTCLGLAHQIDLLRLYKTLRDGAHTAGAALVADSFDGYALPEVSVPSATGATSLIGQASIDVKYDPSRAQFVMVPVENEFTSLSYLARAFSIDGINRTVPQSVSTRPVSSLLARRRYGRRRNGKLDLTSYAGRFRRAVRFE